MSVKLFGSRPLFSPVGGGAIPGSVQEDGAPSDAGGNAAGGTVRQQIEGQLNGLGQRPAEGSTGPIGDEDPFVKITFRDGQEREVKLSHALQLAAQAEEVGTKAEEALRRLNGVRHLEAINTWLEANPEGHSKQLQDLLAGRVQPSAGPSRNSPVIDDDDDDGGGLLRALGQSGGGVPPQTDPILYQRIEALERDRQLREQRDQHNALESFRAHLIETGREKMSNYGIFKNADMRTIGEQMLTDRLSNDAVIAQIRDSGSVVDGIVKVLESAAKTRAERTQRDMRRARELSGGVAPAPRSAGGKQQQVPQGGQRVSDQSVKRKIIDRLIRD